MTTQSPAEALRQQLGKLEVPKMVVWVDKEMKVETDNLTIKTIDDIMELVTAYAATVEREAAIKELNSVKDNHPIVSGFHADCRICKWIDARLAALQGPEK